jgi:hypothetical protein
MQIVETGFPMERIAMDILCELPETSGGNKHILVISDYYTKWTECLAMPNMEAKTVAILLVVQVIVRFGAPYVIHTDQGVQFESNLFHTGNSQRMSIAMRSIGNPVSPTSKGALFLFGGIFCVLNEQRATYIFTSFCKPGQ